MIQPVVRTFVEHPQSLRAVADLKSCGCAEAGKTGINDSPGFEPSPEDCATAADRSVSELQSHDTVLGAAESSGGPGLDPVADQVALDAAQTAGAHRLTVDQ